jgi:hypothetical protein
MDSVQDPNRAGERHIVTEEKLDDNGTRLKYARMSEDVVTKLLKLRPYKAAVVSGLLPPDCGARMRYCGWFQESVFDRRLEANLAFYSGESCFTSSGCR